MSWLLLGAASVWGCTATDMPLRYDGDGLTSDHGLWFDRDPVGLEVVRVSDEVVVPVTVSRFGVSWVALPDEGWAPGEAHVVWLDAWDVATFVAGFEPTPEAGLALPARRGAWTETRLEATDPCGGGDPETVSWSGVRYRVCLFDPWLVVVASEQQPPDPALDDGGDWVVGGDSWSDDDYYGTWSPSGGSATLWFGAVDARGRFGGWTRDELPLPDPGMERDDVRPDAPYGPATTPTVFETCPVAPWELGEPVDGPGCGCDVGSRSTGGLAALLAAALVRRRGRSASEGLRSRR